MGLKLETGKVYINADGRKVRVICTDRKVEGEFPPCVGLVDWDGHEVINSYEKDGTGFPNCSLVREYDLLEGLPVDTPVWVRDDPDEEWQPRHYAGYKNERGMYIAFTDGKTSHSDDGGPKIGWTYMTNVNPNGKV